MAIKGSNVLTLTDWAKRLDPDGKTPKIVELLAQTNEILDDMLFMEGNLAVGHRVTVRTGLPTVYWRLLNKGVQPSKSHTAQVDESAGMLEAWSEVDKDLAMLNGNTGEFRLSEARAFIEAMNQEMASTLFYGNSSISPEEFNGLAIRYSSLSAANAQNVVDAEGTGSDNSSVYLVCWSDQTVFGIFPKGSKAGLIQEDHGETTIENAGGVSGARMRALVERFQWKLGVVLKDWRYVVRIANIDISNLVSDVGAANLTKQMIKAIHRIPNLKMGKCAFYMNRSVAEYLDIQRLAGVSAGGGITYENVDGKMTYMFRGIPIRICDALLESEARVV